MSKATAPKKQQSKPSTKASSPPDPKLPGDGAAPGPPAVNAFFDFVGGKFSRASSSLSQLGEGPSDTLRPAREISRDNNLAISGWCQSEKRDLPAQRVKFGLLCKKVHDLRTSILRRPGEGEGVAKEETSGKKKGQNKKKAAAAAAAKKPAAEQGKAVVFLGGDEEPKATPLPDGYNPTGFAITEYNLAVAAFLSRDYHLAQEILGTALRFSFRADSFVVLKMALLYVEAAIARKDLAGAAEVLALIDPMDRVSSSGSEETAELMSGPHTPDQAPVALQGLWFKSRFSDRDQDPYVLRKGTRARPLPTLVAGVFLPESAASGQERVSVPHVSPVEIATLCRRLRAHLACLAGHFGIGAWEARAGGRLCLREQESAFGFDSVVGVEHGDDIETDLMHAALAEHRSAMLSAVHLRASVLGGGKGGVRLSGPSGALRLLVFPGADFVPMKNADGSDITHPLVSSPHLRPYIFNNVGCILAASGKHGSAASAFAMALRVLCAEVIPGQTRQAAPKKKKGAPHDNTSSLGGSSDRDAWVVPVAGVVNSGSDAPWPTLHGNKHSMDLRPQACYNLGLSLLQSAQSKLSALEGAYAALSCVVGREDDPLLSLRLGEAALSAWLALKRLEATAADAEADCGGNYAGHRLLTGGLRAGGRAGHFGFHGRRNEAGSNPPPDRHYLELAESHFVRTLDICDERLLARQEASDSVASNHTPDPFARDTWVVSPKRRVRSEKGRTFEAPKKAGARVPANYDTAKEVERGRLTGYSDLAALSLAYVWAEKEAWAESGDHALKVLLRNKVYVESVSPADESDSEDVDFMSPDFGPWVASLQRLASGGGAESKAQQQQQGEKEMKRRGNVEFPASVSTVVYAALFVADALHEEGNTLAACKLLQELVGSELLQERLSGGSPLVRNLGHAVDAQRKILVTLGGHASLTPLSTDSVSHSVRRSCGTKDASAAVAPLCSVAMSPAALCNNVVAPTFKKAQVWPEATGKAGGNCSLICGVPDHSAGHVPSEELSLQDMLSSVLLNLSSLLICMDNYNLLGYSSKAAAKMAEVSGAGGRSSKLDQQADLIVRSLKEVQVYEADADCALANSLLRESRRVRSSRANPCLALATLQASEFHRLAVPESFAAHTEEDAFGFGGVRAGAAAAVDSHEESAQNTSEEKGEGKTKRGGPTPAAVASKENSVSEGKPGLAQKKTAQQQQQPTHPNKKKSHGGGQRGGKKR